jgi:hypothetical protein
MDLEVEIGGVVPEPYADDGIFGWEESIITRPVRSDGVLILVCGVCRKFEPGDDNLLEYGMEGPITQGRRLPITDITGARGCWGAAVGKRPHVNLML